VGDDRSGVSVSLATWSGQWHGWKRFCLTTTATIAEVEEEPIGNQPMPLTGAVGSMTFATRVYQPDRAIAPGTSALISLGTRSTLTPSDAFNAVSKLCYVTFRFLNSLFCLQIVLPVDSSSEDACKLATCHCDRTAVECFARHQSTYDASRKRTSIWDWLIWYQMIARDGVYSQSTTTDTKPSTTWTTIKRLWIPIHIKYAICNSARTNSLCIRHLKKKTQKNV